MHLNRAFAVLLASPALAIPIAQLEHPSIAGKVHGLIAQNNSTNIHNGTGAGRDQYRMYTGNGSPASGWPARSDWVSFEYMFAKNRAAMLSSCSRFGVPNNSEAEVSAIRDGILKVATETGVDSRFILAIIMQESTGCVRVHSTVGSHRNPGLMQDHDGAATCNDRGTVQHPCPASTIEQMIRDGTAGTPRGDGLLQCLSAAGSADVAAFYRAARKYNSGHAPEDLGTGGATACYASDVANRLTGWVSAASKCTL
ncbi:muramidase, putative [Cordyceps militaris]|uniref:Muramidase, putative n=1 Tax=Cordyceps militaris TaxID=73501 RepID=A0A2H4SRT3_CORMI|nr:muramidase, putative [Cordyceps militaris]